MIVEVSQFRLADGVSEDDFLAEAEKTQTGFLAKQAGFHSRELLRQENGSWMDIVRFHSQEAASAAFAGFADHPSTRAFEQMLDFSSAAMSHWSQARAW